MASIAFRNSSRRLLRAYFSKLGWQANVIWRIAFFNQLQVYPSWLWRSDLFRASLIDELQGKLNLPRGPSSFADHSKPRAFERVRRQAHVHHVEHIEELPAELKVGTLQTIAPMGNRRCLDDSKVEIVISRPAEAIPTERSESPRVRSRSTLYPDRNRKGRCVGGAEPKIVSPSSS